MRLLRIALGEDDSAAVDRATIGKLGIAMNAFERRILGRIELILSGEPAAKKGAAQLRELEKLILDASKPSSTGAS